MPLEDDQQKHVAPFPREVSEVEKFRNAGQSGGETF
jgi:hypothetical protein